MSRAAAAATTLTERLRNFNVMEPVEKIIDNATNPLTIEIELPKEYQNKKVKVTVTPMDETEAPSKKYDFSEFFGKLKWDGDALAEQRKLRDEWD